MSIDANAKAKFWIQSPSGVFISSQRMQRDGKMFSLYDAANMDVEAFNKEAANYNVHIDGSDPPIDRLVKYAVFLSRKGNDGSALMGNAEYVSVAMETAAKKTSEPFASFYHMLTHDAVDAVSEILAFKEKLEGGANSGKYVAERKVFNGDAVLEGAGDIIVAREGWAEVLGPNGYPVSTNKNECSIQSIDNPAITGNDAKGFWYVGDDPVGQERIVLRGPRWDDVGLLSAVVSRGRSCSIVSVGALRSREAKKPR